MDKLTLISTLLIFTFTNPSYSNDSLGSYGWGPNLDSKEKRLSFFEKPINQQMLVLQITSQFKESSYGTTGGIGFGPDYTKKDGKPTTKAQRIEMILEDSGINSADFDHIKDQVFSSVALKLAQNELNYTFDESDPYKATVSDIKQTQNLENFIDTLRETGKYSDPSEVDKAFKLKEILTEAGDDYKKALAALEKSFEGEDLSRITKDSMYSFEYEEGMQAEFIKTMAKGKIDQSLLRNTISLQLSTLYPVGSTPFFHEEGVLELAAQYYDFNSKQSSFSNDYLICDISKFIFNKTAYKKDQDQIYGKPSPVISLECHDCMIGNQQELSEQERESRSRKVNQSFVNQVAKIMSLGGDAQVICQGGLSPMDHLEIAESEGLISLEDFRSMTSASSDRPCRFDIIDQTIPSLCEMSGILSWAGNQIKQQAIMVKGHKKKNAAINLTSSYSTDNCNFSLINKQLKRNGLAETQSLELTITPIEGKGKISISNKDKEEFLTKLEGLIRNK